MRRKSSLCWNAGCRRLRSVTRVGPTRSQSSSAASPPRRGSGGPRSHPRHSTSSTSSSRRTHTPQVRLTILHSPSPQWTCSRQCNQPLWNITFYSCIHLKLIQAFMQSFASFFLRFLPIPRFDLFVLSHPTLRWGFGCRCRSCNILKEESAFVDYFFFCLALKLNISFTTWALWKECHGFAQSFDS